jgi:hypothetical protein
MRRLSARVATVATAAAAMTAVAAQPASAVNVCSTFKNVTTAAYVPSFTVSFTPPGSVVDGNFNQNSVYSVYAVTLQQGAVTEFVSVTGVGANVYASGWVSLLWQC